jgi:sucrose phosphorylase
LLGSRSWKDGVTQTGRLRTINREKLRLSEVDAALDDRGSLRSAVFHAYRALISKRTAEKAFHPGGPQRVLELHPAAFTLLRSAPDGSEHILAIHNVAHRGITVDLSQVPLAHGLHYRDLISGATVEAKASLAVLPYQVLWLKAQDG